MNCLRLGASKLMLGLLCVLWLLLASGVSANQFSEHGNAPVTTAAHESLIFSGICPADPCDTRPSLMHP